MHRTVVFDSTWPNDWVFSDSGDPIAPGARELAEAVAAKIGDQGPEVGLVEQHSNYGWGFWVLFRKCSFFLVLNPVLECYLTISLDCPILELLAGRRPRATFRDFCGRVEAALRALDGVSNVRWDAA